MQIKEVMTSNPITLSVENTLNDTAEIFIESNIDSAPVVDKDYCLVGIFTKSDFFSAIKNKKPYSTKIEQIMNKNFTCISEEDNASIVFDKVEEKFPVVNYRNQLAGILTKTDLLKAYYRKLKYTINNLNAILSSTNNAIIAIDTQECLTFFNKSAEKILGVTATQVLGKKILDVLPDSSLPKILKTGQKEISRTISMNGKTLVTNRTPIISDENKIIGAVAVFQDITDYENIVQELHNEQNETAILKTILEIAYDGIVVVDKDGFITMISNAYKKFLGLEDDEVIGKHVTEIIENTRMHIVAKNGLPEVADLQKIKGNYMIATRIPIIKEGNIVGAVGKVLFRNIDELNALHKKIGKMEQELEQYKGELKKVHTARYSFDSLLGKSKEIKMSKFIAKKAAHTDSNVLLIGESGTGKELFAHAIHKDSRRASFPFVKVNCAAIPHELLESELFGYETGAFTGAKKGGKIGKFEVADGGTIFLDEIGDMPLHMQAKLLRVLQEKEIERIGSNTPQKIDVRIIAATNRNLEEMVNKGDFRNDLYYRLNVVTINIPPLRERFEDIENLAYYFVDKIRTHLGKHIEKISEEALKYLKNYPWPGNIRELENVIERAVNIIDKESVILPKHLPDKITGEISAKEINSLKDILEDAEKQALIDALKLTRGNKSKAAQLLKLSRSSFYEKITKYQLM